MSSKPSGEPGWFWRRWILFPNIIASFVGLWWMRDGPDTVVNQVIAQGFFWNIILSIIIYTGFATFQDIAAIWVTKSGRPYQQEMQPAEPERVGDSIPDPAAKPSEPE